MKIGSRIHNTSEILKFIDYLNNQNFLTEYNILVPFDIVTIFPSINYQYGSQTVINALETRQAQIIFLHLKLCLYSNNVIFSYKHFVQREVFLVWLHSNEDIDLFLTT